MKREERQQLNGLQGKGHATGISDATLYVEIPMHYSDEGKQAIHEYLSMRNLKALRINWNPTLNEYTVLYAPMTEAEKRQAHDVESFASIVNDLRVTDTYWNGYKKQESSSNGMEAETMTEKKDIAAKQETEKKASKASKKPTALEKDLAVAMPLIEKAKAGKALEASERAILAHMIKESYHDSGKIEGLFSIDSCATLCSFCKTMREAAKNNPAHICGHCYASRGYMSWRSVRDRHELNMMILSSVPFVESDFRYLIHGSILRINCDGDFENVLHAQNILIMTRANPHCTFGIWTKNIKALSLAANICGKPENCIFIASSPIIDVKIPCPAGFDYTFTVYSTEAVVADAINNGAMECNGRKCRDCGYSCYLGTWPRGANIAELLR